MVSPHRRSSEKRESSDMTGYTRSEGRRPSGRTSGTTDEYGFNEFNTQELHDVMDGIESNPTSPEKVTKYAPLPGRLHSARRKAADMEVVARRFDHGSQPSAKGQRRKDDTNQRKVDTFFSVSKPGFERRAHRKSSGSTKITQPRTSALFSEHDTADVFRGAPAPLLAHDTSAKKGEETSFKFEFKAGIPMPGLATTGPKIDNVGDQVRCRQPQVPLQGSFISRNPNPRKSFGELANGSQTTSQSSMFSEGRSFNAAAPGLSPDTSFAESVPGSQNMPPPLTPAKQYIASTLASNVQTTTLEVTSPAASPAAVSFGGEHFRIRNLPSHGLFAPRLPTRILSASAWVRYECTRLANHYSIPFETLATMDASTFEDYDTLWKTFRRFAAPNITSPPRTSLAIWERAKVGDPSVCRTAALRFAKNDKTDLFDLVLRPLQTDRSCRFFRKFGSHRFLKLSLPSTVREKLPDHIDKQSANLQLRYVDWVKATNMELSGYYWSAFCVKPRSNRKTTIAVNKVDEESRMYDVFLFATHGCGLHAVSVTELIDWFMPMRLNGSAMACKLSTRIELGLSKTLRTLTFRPSQIIEVGDIIADGSEEDSSFNDPKLAWPRSKDYASKAVMNDGCSKLSIAAAKQIWALLLETGPLPSIFQARIGPWKGVWMVSPPTHTRGAEDVWIEVTPSQRKFNRHFDDMHDSTAVEMERLTFEVLQWSHLPKESTLYLDYLPLLADRGVPRDTLEQLVKKMLDAKKESLEGALRSRQTLYHWIDGNFSMDMNDRETLDQPIAPQRLADSIQLLLDSGFEFSQYRALQMMVKNLVKSYFQRVSGDLKLPITNSTMVMGVADPLGVLAPGEIQMAFSGGLGDNSETLLHDMRVLVGRHPACRRSDIQKVKAVFKPELRHLKDVVVFSSRGQIPLASKLQGGDYDGDKFWVCWESAMVDPFLNAPCPSKNPQPGDLGMIVNRQTVSDLINWEAEVPTQAFSNMALGFAMQPSFLGIATYLHSNICYNQNQIAGPAIDRLADLHDLLVDSAKNGYCFSSEQWEAFQRDLPNVTKREKKNTPAYKTSKEGLKASLTLAKYAHIVDHLVLGVAIPHASAIWKDIENLSSGALPTDPALCQQYMLESTSGNLVVQEVLSALSAAIVEVFNSYRVTRVGLVNRPKRSAKDRLDAIDKADRDARARYKGLEPQLQQRETLAALGWFRKLSNAHVSHWDCVKASCLFSTLTEDRKDSKGSRNTISKSILTDDFLFACDAHNICYLKAYSGGDGRPSTVVSSIYRHKRMRKVKVSPEYEHSSRLSSFDFPDAGRVDDDGNDTEMDTDDEANEEY